jgi:cytochrome c
MKLFIAIAMVASLTVAYVAIAADTSRLHMEGCTSCHAPDKRLIGPSWIEIASKYRDDSGAEAILIDRVANGSVGVWGKTSMPALNNRMRTDAYVKPLVEAVLSYGQTDSNLESTGSANTSATTQTVNIEVIDPTTECITQIPFKKELQILNGKILLDGSANYSFEMLANNSFPSKKEMKAISLWVNEHKRCKQIGNEWRTSRYPAAPLALVDKLYSDNIFLAADLYAKKISYGDFAKGVVKANQEFSVSTAALQQQQQLQLRQQQQAKQQQKDAIVQQQQRDTLLRQQQSEQQHQEALARQQQLEQAQQQQAALLQQQQYLYRQQQIQQQQQQQIYTPPRSTQSTCGWQGNQWVCNTAPTGIDWGILQRR